MAEQTETKTEATQEGSKAAPATLRTILGEKVGMTQVYHPKDKMLYDVTIVKAGPCPILRVKTADGKDGYNAVQLGFGEKKEKNVAKSLLGQFKKAGIAPQRYVREVRVKDVKGLEAGQLVTAAGAFKSGDYVDVQGTSKGKGFAGVMKRHNFAGKEDSHGTERKHRSTGSVGAGTTPGRVFKGMKGPGHLGHDRTTILSLEVVEADAERNLLLIKGAIPGPNGGLVMVRNSVKRPVK